MKPVPPVEPVPPVYPVAPVKPADWQNYFVKDCRCMTIRTIALSSQGDERQVTTCIKSRGAQKKQLTVKLQECNHTLETIRCGITAVDF